MFRVYSREAFVANLVTTTVDLLCHLNVNLTNTINPPKLRIKLICHHICKFVWTPVVDEMLECEQDTRTEAKEHDEQ